MVVKKFTFFAKKLVTHNFFLNNGKIFCKHVQKASSNSSFYILRRSKAIDITSYPSFHVMSITFEPSKL